MDAVKKVSHPHWISQEAIDTFIARDEELVRATCLTAIIKGETFDSVMSGPRFDMILSDDEIHAIVDESFNKGEV
jgi:hypothetical protein